MPRGQSMNRPDVLSGFMYAGGCVTPSGPLVLTPGPFQISNRLTISGLVNSIGDEILSPSIMILTVSPFDQPIVGIVRIKLQIRGTTSGRRVITSKLSTGRNRDTES